METEAQAPSNCLYYTLSPLSLPTGCDSDDLPPPQEQSDGSGPYVVYRCEIPLTELHFVVYEDSVVDYFSLDGGGGEAGEDPTEKSEPRTPIRGTEMAETSAKTAMALESGWFGGNRKFRSPMIQLHKEKVDFCEFLSPTQEEQKSRNTAVDRVTETVKYIWPNCQNVRASQPFPEHNLGVLLVHFFEFYVRQLNTSEVGISCRSGGTFYSKISRGFYNIDRPSLISIEDPQAPDNGIEKNSFNYFQIEKDECSLPRGGVTPGSGGSDNSRKRKAASREKSKKKKLKDAYNDNDDKVRHVEENGKKKKGKSEGKRQGCVSGNKNGYVGRHRYAKGSPWQR